MSAAARGDALAAIEASGVIAILRGDFSHELETILDALVHGGVRAVEISLTSPVALRQIARAASAGRDVAVGAGTVLTRDDVERVHAAGATFIVSPIVDPYLIDAALAANLVPIPGAFTPTEAVAANRAGAPAVKLFPGDVLGARFVRGVLAPLPHLKLVPTGGITLPLASELAAAGAWAVGVGSPLLSALTEGGAAALAVRARAFVSAMRPAKGDR